ncbi:hypothetical protein MPSEU_000842600 [Mayamaea pseudoterrestris]|nr:hypothetical protein MPSEU_000842600 [Mayamaea pseudoterrestris]
MGRRDDVSSSSSSERHERRTSKKHSKKRSKERKSKRKRHQRDDSSSSDDQDRHRRKKHDRKRERKHDNSKDKKDKKRRRSKDDDADDEVSHNMLQRNIALADALCQLFSSHPDLVDDLVSMLIRMGGGASFNLSQMTNRHASSCLEAVFVAMQPLGVARRETDNVWEWKGPKDDLVLIRVIRAMLDQLGLTEAAIETYESDLARDAARKQTQTAEDSIRESCQRIAQNLLRAFRDEKQLTKELASLCTMILEGESIALDGLPNEKLRIGLERLFESCRLEKSEMEQDDSDNDESVNDATEAVMGFALPNVNHELAASLLKNIIRVCRDEELANNQGRRSIAGPMLNPEDYAGQTYAAPAADESDDEEGPVLYGTAHSNDMTDEAIKSAAEKRAGDLQYAKTGVMPPSARDETVREEWMVDPGKFDFLSNIKSGQPMRSRGFQADGAIATNDPTAVKQRKDPKIQAEIDAIHQAHDESRGPALLELHRQRKAQEAALGKSKGDKWKWDRDKDLSAGRHVDKAHLNAVFGGAGADLKQKFHKVLQTAIGETSVDLLGVVMDVTVSKAPFPIHVLWLCDDSITAETKLAVSIKIQQQQQAIVVGDVVRMNSVKLVSSEEYAAASTRIYHFAVNAFDPASTYAVLGRIQGDDFQEYSNNTKHAAFADPGSMATHPSCIERLVEWYSRRQQRQDQPAALSALSLLRRFQTLSELQSSHGIVSHACARVLDVQTHVSNSPRSRKQQHRLIGSKSQTYALLQDLNDETTLTFVDSLDKWTPLLQTAQSTCQAVQMFYVKTGLCEDNVVLLPTRDTRIVLMDEDSIVNHSKSTEAEHLDAAQSQFMLSLTQQQHEDCSQPQQVTIRASIHSLQVQFNDKEQLQVSKSTSQHDFDIFATRLVKCLNNSRHERIDVPFGRLTLCVHSNHDHADGNKIMVGLTHNDILLARLLGGCTSSDGSLGKLNAATASALLKALIYHQVQLQWTLEQICVARDSENNGCEYAAINVEHVGGL